MLHHIYVGLQCTCSKCLPPARAQTRRPWCHIDRQQHIQ